MSVIGIDFGNENCYIAVARSGGIETIANEYSQRSTPTYVAFGEKTRDLGVSAKNKQITNLKNTLFSFKHLFGRKYQDPVIQQELRYVPFQTTELPTGELGFQVDYLQEKTVFTAQQVMAMMFTKLKEISEANLEIKVQDCVVSVPVYYTDAERRAILDSAEIAGLNILKLMNEPTAVALAYGFYNQDLPEETPKIVVIVDLGNSSLQAIACAFTKGKLKVLGSSWNHNLGGRDFDNVLVKYFVDDFDKRYNLDILNNKRAVVRLLQECEKLKKQMSANSVVLPLNIECLMDDKDVSGKMKREDFERLSSNLLEHIEYTLLTLLHDSRLKPEEIDSVQIVGGSSRIPAFKAVVQKVFGKEPSTTLNQDEAVARGCALQCAMLSPTFKVKDFSITDIQPYPISLMYKASKIDESSEAEIFPLFHPVPYSKLVTFFRTEPFTLDAYYADQSSSIGNSKIGSFTITNVSPTLEGEASKVKVKARINIHGVFSISSATMIEKQPIKNAESSEATVNTSNGSENKVKKEDTMDSENDSGSPNGATGSDVVNEGNVPENEKPEPEQKKSKSVSIELPIKCDVPSLSRDVLNDFVEKEGKMVMQNKMEKERADAKNAVEEYVYEYRDKLVNGGLRDYCTEQEKEQFIQVLDDTENWLYDEGEEQQKSVYVQKLNSLRKYGDPMLIRIYEWKHRPKAIEDLYCSLQLILKALQSYEAKEELYNHIDKESMRKIQELWDETDQWYERYVQPFSKFLRHQDPPVYAEAIRKQHQDFENRVWPLLLKPKPKVEPPTEDSVNGPQTDCEMRDTNSSEKVEKQSQPSGDKAFTQANPENMETN